MRARAHAHARLHTHACPCSHTTAHVPAPIRTCTDSPTCARGCAHARTTAHVHKSAHARDHHAVTCCAVSQTSPPRDVIGSHFIPRPISPPPPPRSMSIFDMLYQLRHPPTPSPRSLWSCRRRPSAPTRTARRPSASGPLMPSGPPSGPPSTFPCLPPLPSPRMKASVTLRPLSCRSPYALAPLTLRFPVTPRPTPSLRTLQIPLSYASPYALAPLTPRLSLHYGSPYTAAPVHWTGTPVASRRGALWKGTCGPLSHYRRRMTNAMIIIVCTYL
jgi:hypothetical protein